MARLVTLESRLNAIAAELKPRAVAAIHIAANGIEESAKARVPVGESSPHLRDAIHVRPDDDGAAVVAGNDDLFYGHMVEFGTRNAAPRPFLIPALEMRRAEVTKIVAEALKSL